MLKNIFLQITLILVPFLLYAQPDRDLQKILASLPRGTGTSILMLDADKNIIIFENNLLIPLRPASCVKIFTTASALMLLGKDFKLTTSLYFNEGNIKDGVLYDNLYLKGYGNALLNMADLDYMANEIKRYGIKKIAGCIVYDNSFFKKENTRLNQMEILSPLIIPSLSPISINRNIIELIITKGINGISIKSFPSSRYISLANNVTISANGNKVEAILEEKRDRFNIKIAGNLTDNLVRKVYLFVKNPDLLTSLLLQEKLETFGIQLNEFPRQGILPSSSFTGISSSLLLTDILKGINKNSDNYLAETLQRISGQYFNKPGKGGNPLISYLASAKVDVRNLQITDGSGISNDNRMTSNSLAGILHMIYKDRNCFNVFKSTLSAAGVDGTLKELFLNSPVKNNFLGKTGYLNGTSSICGYLRTSAGKNLIIAIIINYKTKGIDFYRGVEKKIIETVFNNN